MSTVTKTTTQASVNRKRINTAVWIGTGAVVLLLGITILLKDFLINEVACSRSASTESHIPIPSVKLTSDTSAISKVCSLIWGKYKYPIIAASILLLVLGIVGVYLCASNHCIAEKDRVVLKSNTKNDDLDIWNLLILGIGLASVCISLALFIKRNNQQPLNPPNEILNPDSVNKPLPTVVEEEAVEDIALAHSQLSLDSDDGDDDNDTVKTINEIVYSVLKSPMDRLKDALQDTGSLPKPNRIITLYQNSRDELQAFRFHVNESDSLLDVCRRLSIKSKSSCIIIIVDKDDTLTCSLKGQDCKLILNSMKSFEESALFDDIRIDWIQILLEEDHNMLSGVNLS